MAIELRVMQFWSEITRMISDQIALHSVQLPLWTWLIFTLNQNYIVENNADHTDVSIVTLLKSWKHVTLKLSILLLFPFSGFHVFRILCSSKLSMKPNQRESCNYNKNNRDTLKVTSFVLERKTQIKILSSHFKSVRHLPLLD